MPTWSPCVWVLSTALIRHPRAAQKASAAAASGPSTTAASPRAGAPSTHTRLSCPASTWCTTISPPAIANGAAGRVTTCPSPMALSPSGTRVWTAGALSRYNPPMLLWILAGFAVALVPFIVIAVNAQRKYRGLFGDDHLHEVATTLATLKREADASDAPPSALTSHGLALTWDASCPEITFSHRDGKLHATAAGFLAAFIEALAAPPAGTTTRRLRRAGRYVLALTLPGPADAAYRAAALAVPAPDAFAPLRAAAAEAMRTVTFERA